MPNFKVLLSGRGIDLAMEDDSAIGFFTTRLVRADDQKSAESLASDLVLSEWRLGGAYAQANRGDLPVLSIEQSFSVGWFEGVFGRKASGYVFYCHED